MQDTMTLPAKSGRLGPVIDWLVLSVGIISLSFSVAATVIGGDTDLSSAEQILGAEPLENI